VYYNSAATGSNHYLSSCRYNCTTPSPDGEGNITNAPQFMNAAANNYRLAASSPCINAGNNAHVKNTTDLDRHPRIEYSVVDMGAYEIALHPFVDITNTSPVMINYSETETSIGGTNNAYLVGTMWWSTSSYQVAQTTGNGNIPWNYPFYTYHKNARVQSLYPASEVGEARTIHALALDVITVPELPINNWTIRLKQSTLTNYAYPYAWDESEWTTVYQADETITSTGWVEFAFSTPFTYYGTYSLAVDFSFSNSSSSINMGDCRCSTSDQERSLYGYSILGPYSSTKVPNIKWISTVPDRIGTFTPSNNAWSVPIPNLVVGSNRITVSGTNVYGQQANDTITINRVGPVDHFQWTPIGTRQYWNLPFGVTITARDANDFVATEFTNTVDMRGYIRSISTNVTIGAGGSSWNHPLYTLYHDARTQVIYLTNDLPGSCMITSLAMNVTQPPGQTLNQWTIRMKHTTLSSYGLDREWESNGWTIVYQNNESISTTNWVAFPLSTPFAYNGTDHLMIDFSFNNTSYSLPGQCLYTDAAEERSIHARSDSEDGDPLTWAETSPSPIRTTKVPNIRLLMDGGEETPVTIAPMVSGNFIEGVWNGTVTVLHGTTNMYLHADDGVGHTGDSSLFDVLNPASEPIIDITNASPSYAVYNQAYTVIRGTNLNIAGMWWTNSLTGENGNAQTSNSAFQTSTINLSHGDNPITIYGTNSSGHLAHDMILIHRETLAEVQPLIDITNENVMVNYDVTSYTIRGTNWLIAGDLGWADENEGTNWFSRSGDTWSVTVTGLEEGTNLIKVVGTNLYGHWTDDTVTITRETLNEVLPVIAITDAPVNIPFGETSATISGTNLNLTGDLGWVDDTESTNWFSRSGDTWSVTVTGLEEGTNVINVVGTNTYGHWTSDQVIIIRQAQAEPGLVDHFVWSSIGLMQNPNVPFHVSVTARDTNNFVATGFTNIVDFRGYKRSITTITTNVTIGTGGSSWNYPLRTYYHDARTQVIYRTNDLPGSCMITSLALNVTTSPGQALNQWTIRMKHTTLNSYGTSPQWETNAWTTVYQNNEPILSTGWVAFPFSTPFEYNGTNNLMIDFSFNNTSYSSDGQCLYTDGTENRSIYYRSDSWDGDPLTWNAASPTPSSSTSVPNIRLSIKQEDEAPVAITPTTSGTFVNGIWSGELTVLEVVTNIYLRADDRDGHHGESNPFDVSPGKVPQWWINYNVLNLTAATNDYTVANSGQLKHIASKAREAMNVIFTNSGGAGSTINTLVNAFQNTNNYVVINLGQLKHVAVPFYDRLSPNHTNGWPVGMITGPYPWSGSTNVAQDYSPGNVGQLKYIFSFEIRD